MDDIFIRILDLTSYISSPLLHFLEDLYFGIFNGCPAVEYPSSASYHERQFTFKECASSSNHSVATHRGTQRRLVNAKEHLCVNTGTEAGDTHGGTSLVLKRLTLPLCGLRLFRRLALASWRCFLGFCKHTIERVKSIISRVQKGLRGSSDDIGWMQRTPGLPPVKDGTTRFLELLQGVRNGKHILPDSFVYLLIPGLFSNHGPLYFVATKRFFSKMGLACHIAKIHSEASVEHNAWVLKNYIEELYWGSGKRVMLLGHSKGGVDAAAALSKYWPDLQGKVAGLALVQSPYGGTPIASDVLREGQVADKKARRVMELLICKLIKGDFQAMEDLTYEKRKDFILSHKLPEEIPLISFHSEANIAPSVLATLTQIAHAELPWFPLPTFSDGPSNDCVQPSRKVPVVIPLSAAMAVCALHLRLRYGEKSDGLVTCRDAEVPGSVVIRPDKKFDHAWMVYSSWKKNPTEPDCCEMCEAILTLLVELGETKNKGKNKW
ncbi:uncharacterized protein LOC104902270 isoform X1 [Beta vulgaris subsp. vulgaris]|uniref:uncharacterized protein LOC104902270 isoform X1 n=1 Tax=Beta vulgaris subsp. vulgaris TaxID=3555 RepID=UPI002036F1C7|nr:uncharacterized protein LOC104902270 isoform X1 [Beta vulgaris subsp. vulgaris]